MVKGLVSILSHVLRADKNGDVWNSDHPADIIFVKTFTLADFAPIIFYPKARNSRHITFCDKSVEKSKRSSPCLNNLSLDTPWVIKCRRCEDAKMRRGFQKIWRAEDAKMRSCGEGFRKSGELKMRRCEDVMLRQPPQYLPIQCHEDAKMWWCKTSAMSTQRYLSKLLSSADSELANSLNLPGW